MDNFLYNNRTYRIIEILKIKNIDFVIYLNSSFQYQNFESNRQHLL